MTNERTTPPRPSRGRDWIVGSVGLLRAGDSLAEWGYITPQFPHGIANSALARANILVQRETAIIWFNMNLQPYDLSEGGPYLAFDSSGPNLAGLDQGRFAPSQIDALAPLLAEFTGTLSDQVIRAIALEFSGQWMRVDESRHPDTPAEDKASLLARLESLRQQVEAMSPAQGGVGNNGPSENFPFTSNEQTEVVSTITDIERLVPDATAADRAAIERQTATVLGYARTLGVWITEGLVKGAAKQAGGELWSVFHQHIDLWYAATEAVKFLMRFIDSL